MKKVLLFISILFARNIIAQPLPNLTCATKISGACNDDTLFYQCCFIPTCSPTTLEVDAWFDFCIQSPMSTSQVVQFFSEWGFRGYTLWGPLTSTANCSDTIPANIYSSSSVAIAPSPYNFFGLPAGKYIIHLRLNECYGYVFQRNLGFSSECLTCGPSCHPVTLPGGEACTGEAVNVSVTSCKGGSASVTVNYGDSFSQSGSTSYLSGIAPIVFNSSHSYTSPGTYTIIVSVTTATGTETHTSTITINDCDLPCENCIGSFAPSPGRYLFSAWVKEDGAPLSKTSYNFPEVTLVFPSFSTVGPFSASGQIIDGWQRIEKEFTVPVGATQMDINLSCTTGDCYFDDIRIFPFEGSMKSYVFDPVTLRLSAELDQRNYATFFEYDEEGKLVRVKKETEKGIMTIQESKTSTIKK